MSVRLLPLGVDIGSTRVRIAQTWLEGDALVLRRVIVLEHGAAELSPAELGGALAERLANQNVRERRCTLACAEPAATLRTVTFPPMSPPERRRAARFEAGRFIEGLGDEHIVQTEPIDEAQGLYALGIVERTTLERRLATVAAARLRVFAVDHESYALRRAFPYADAILDMGHERARLYAYGSSTPVGVALDGGSQTFTSAIARALDVDAVTAERRKRATGFAGAGESELAAFTHSVGRALLNANGAGAGAIQRIVLCGNGARLLGLAARLERDTGCTVDVASHVAVSSSAYAEDVVGASAPDWALAIGLSCWNVPAHDRALAA